MWKAYIALFIVNLIYGANYLIAKDVMPLYIGPSGLVLARVLGAGALFWIVNGASKEKIERKDFIQIILCALFGVVINQMCSLNGLNLTSPIDASIIMTSLPVFVVVFSYFVDKDKITTNKLLGILLGSVGAIVLIIMSATAPSKTSHWVGNLLVFINALSYSFYLVIVKPLMKKYNPLTVIKWVFLFALLMVFPVSSPQFLSVDWNSLPTSAILGIVYVVFATTFLAYLLNLYSLRVVSSSVAGSFIYFQPVVAMCYVLLQSYFSVGIYTQDITPVKLGCVVLVFAGVYLISKR